MTNDRSFFEKLNDTLQIEIVLANASTTKSAGIGEGYVKCLGVDGKMQRMLFKEVLYIPDLDSGFRSVRKMTQKGLAMQFGASKCEIVNIEGKVTAAADLFVLRMTEKAKTSSEKMHLQNCQNTWHRRLDYRDPMALERIKTESLGEDFVVQYCGLRLVCEHCLQGKLHRNSFPKATRNRAK